MATKERFNELFKESKSNGEKNDCAVRAAALVCNISYSEAHALLKKHGRKDRDGTYPAITRSAIKSTGIKLVEVERDFFISQYPKFGSTSVTTKHPKVYPDVWKNGKMYLCHTSSHVLVINDGVTCDWSENRNLRIKKIFEVQRDDHVA
jgi:hypothetical protein